MTIYRNETGNGTVEFTVVMDTAGISVLVSATEDLLNIMVLVGNADLKGMISLTDVLSCLCCVVALTKCRPERRDQFN